MLNLIVHFKLLSRQFCSSGVVLKLDSVSFCGVFNDRKCSYFILQCFWGS